ncbi:hypothetical protein OB905_09525 [Halobacteria archaeon AArc-dxtr1]|nr:hypothetical protein [Halobacteria archaeon AArc-dxtr1]
MRLSIPGFPGVYYETDAKNTAATVALSAAARRAPKPQGYALHVLPTLWSFEVDLREVPADHPLQYLHPEGARSLATLTTNPDAQAVGTDLEAVVRFAWEVNREAGAAADRMIEGGPFGPVDAPERGGGTAEGTVIEIDDGSVAVGGSELDTDEFDPDDE